jgi:hypothetical protein
MIDDWLWQNPAQKKKKKKKKNLKSQNLRLNSYEHGGDIFFTPAVIVMLSWIDLLEFGTGISSTTNSIVHHHDLATRPSIVQVHVMSLMQERFYIAQSVPFILQYVNMKNWCVFVCLWWKFAVILLKEVIGMRMKELV